MLWSLRAGGSWERTEGNAVEESRSGMGAEVLGQADRGPNWSSVQSRGILFGFIYFLFIHLWNRPLHVKILVDSHGIVRSNTQRSRVPSAQGPPVVTSCKTTAQHRNQNLDTDARRPSTDTSPVWLVRTCVCVFSLYNSIACVGSSSTTAQILTCSITSTISFVLLV